MAEKLVCQSDGCVKPADEDGQFCSWHEYKLITGPYVSGLARIVQYLRLEAEFCAYCADNGLPHPHE